MVRALAKLEAVLPHRLQRQVNAVRMQQAGPENTEPMCPTQWSTQPTDVDRGRHMTTRRSASSIGTTNGSRSSRTSSSLAATLVSSAATPRPTNGPAFGSTGCSCGSPAAGDSRRSSCQGGDYLRLSCYARRLSLAGTCMPGSRRRAVGGFSVGSIPIVAVEAR